MRLHAPNPQAASPYAFTDVDPRQRGLEPGIEPVSIERQWRRIRELDACLSPVRTVNVWASFEVDCSVESWIRPGGSASCE